MVESVLREAGDDVGLYTSPHLDDVRERVRIDGRKITRRAVREFVETAEPYITERAADGASPTFFETTTALAADRGADIVRVHDVEENVAAVRTAEAADDSSFDAK